MSKTFLVEFAKGDNATRSIQKSSLSVKGSGYHIEPFQPKKRGTKAKSTSIKAEKQEEHLPWSAGGRTRP